MPSTIGADQGAKEGQAGLASGLVNTSRQVGGGLGLALLITLATQHTTHLIGESKSVTDSLTEGFRLAYLIGAGLVAAAAVAHVRLPSLARGEEVPARQRVCDRRRCGRHPRALRRGRLQRPRRWRSRSARTRRRARRATSRPRLSIRPRSPSPTSAATDKLAPGYLLTANFYDVDRPPIVGQSGPLILDNHLQPVWFQPVPEDVVASNLSAQTYHGKPVLAWWQGVVTNAGTTESGEYVVVDQHYKTVAHAARTQTAGSSRSTRSSSTATTRG